MDLDNGGYLYSAFSIPQTLPLRISSTLAYSSYQKQSLRQHKCDWKTRYRDTLHFQDPLRLKKGYYFFLGFFKISLYDVFFLISAVNLSIFNMKQFNISHPDLNTEEDHPDDRRPGDHLPWDCHQKSEYNQLIHF